VIFGLLNLGVTLAIIRNLGASNDVLLRAGSQIAVGIIFVLVFVLLVDRARLETQRAESLLKDLRTANLQLKAAHQKEKELAIAEERMRLARDIHDGLGHHLTVLSIQLQAADKMVKRDPQAAAKAIRLSRAEARAALEEVRQSVGMMRQSPADSQPLPELLATLVRDFSQHADLQASFEQSGAPIDLSSFARQTLFRAVQESLTNVQKHGRGVTQIEVLLKYARAAVRLVVRDDGQAPEPAPGGTGFGLTGLRERVERLGGSLSSGRGRDGGFEVELRIPLQEATHDQGSTG
jgi:signal transduction histidine kinase